MVILAHRRRAFRVTTGDYPQVQSVTETAFASDATTHNANYPATVNSGDLLLILCTFNDVSTITTPSGYTQLYLNTVLGADPTEACGAAYVKSAAGTEGGGTINVATATNATGTVQIYRITGWSGTLGDIEANSVSLDNDPWHDPPSLTLAAGAGNNLWIAVDHSGDDDKAIISWPANYSYGVDTACGGGSNENGRTASARRQTQAATENPDKFVITIQRGVAATIGIPPYIPQSTATATSTPTATSTSSSTATATGTSSVTYTATASSTSTGTSTSTATSTSTP